MLLLSFDGKIENAVSICSLADAERAICKLWCLIFQTTDRNNANAVALSVSDFVARNSSKYRWRMRRRVFAHRKPKGYPFGIHRQTRSDAPQRLCGRRHFGNCFRASGRKAIARRRQSRNNKYYSRQWYVAFRQKLYNGQSVPRLCVSVIQHSIRYA